MRIRGRGDSVPIASRQVKGARKVDWTSTFLAIIFLSLLNAEAEALAYFKGCPIDYTLTGTAVGSKNVR